MLFGRPILLRVLVFREPHDPNTWVAQALEYDIAAYGNDVAHAKVAFGRTVTGYFQLAERSNQEPFASLPAAPDAFWEIWQKVADQQVMQAEPIRAMHGHILPVVTNEPVQAAH